ncbi:MAG: tetratricopeptide repeat protein [Alphaproteobacteria bacterium]|nr:tetratricopeptide repeat protein [Alphaproteobacteria bacterium]
MLATALRNPAPIICAAFDSLIRLNIIHKDYQKSLLCQVITKYCNNVALRSGTFGVQIESFHFMSIHMRGFFFSHWPLVPFLRRVSRHTRVSVILLMCLFLSGCVELWLGSRMLAGQINPKPRIEFQQALKKAEEGDIEAQVKVADWLSAGCMGRCAFGSMEWRPACDPEKSTMWYTQAAEAGNVSAQRRLAEIYRHGLMKQKLDMQTSLTWYRRAASQGDRSSIYQLAEIYDNGRGVPEDKVEAAGWYLQLATKNEPGHARMRLAEMYAKGEGLPQDTEAARAWGLKAAINGPAPYLPRMAVIFAEAPPPDYTEAYYWAFLAQERFLRWRTALSRDQYLAEIEKQLSEYSAHLTEEQVTGTQVRVKADLARFFR